MSGGTNPCVLGIDIGTTSVKCCLVDTVTKEVVSSQKKDTYSNVPSELGKYKLIYYLTYLLSDPVSHWCINLNQNSLLILQTRNITYLVYGCSHSQVRRVTNRMCRGSCQLYRCVCLGCLGRAWSGWCGWVCVDRCMVVCYGRQNMPGNRSPTRTGYYLPLRFELVNDGIYIWELK